MWNKSIGVYIGTAVLSVGDALKSGDFANGVTLMGVSIVVIETVRLIINNRPEE